MDDLVESGIAPTDHRISMSAGTVRSASDESVVTAPAVVARYDGQSVAAGESPIRSLSIVIPVHNEEGNLEELHLQLTDSLMAIGLPYEIVFVDDGSSDGTWRIIKQL